MTDKSESTWTGRVAVVTGGESGIGRATARRLASLGVRVFVGDITLHDENRDEFARLGIDSRRCDVRSLDDLRTLIDSAAERAGRLDILVNNAGIANIGTATTTVEADFDRVMKVNVKGVFLCLQAILPSMIEAGGGVILNMSSIAAITGLKERFAYSASKGAVHTMTLSIAADYLANKIRCNAICPARVHTPFVDGYLDRNYPDNREEMFAKLSAAQPIGRMARPDEIARLALYLCSDDASFITGQMFNIDGGYLNLRN